MGNKSCDMDSFISVFLLSLFRNIYQKNKIPIEINFENSNKIYIPIFNCKKEDFNDRLDIFYLCNKNQIKKYSVALTNMSEHSIKVFDWETYRENLKVY